MILRTLPLARLIPAGYNPRRVSNAAYRRLKASLERFGLVEPLIWNERTGRVVGGHLRLRILHELGAEEAPVSVVHLSDADEKALNVVLNNLEAQGRYDAGKLLELLKELDADLLPATGFEPRDLKAMDLAPSPDALPEDATGEMEVTLIASRGVYAALAEPLDDLIRRFDLISHVRERPASASARA